jgi:hypothetical protein
MIGKKVNRPTPFWENDKYWVYDIMLEHYFGIHVLHDIDILYSGCFRVVIKFPSMLMHFLLNMIPCAFFFFVDTTVQFWLGIWFPVGFFPLLMWAV